MANNNRLKYSTLDMLDEHLSVKNDDVLNQSDEIRYRVLKEEFMLDRTYWLRYYKNLEVIQFEWNEFKYIDIKNKKDIDNIIRNDDIGVYLFIVKPENTIYDLPKYVFYVGIAGERGSGRSLKTRLKDYFNLDAIKKRSNVHRMLYTYYKDVYIAFATFKSYQQIDLESLEVNLHGYFCPIINKRDFPVEIKNLRKAF